MRRAALFTMLLALAVTLLPASCLSCCTQTAPACCPPAQAAVQPPCCMPAAAAALPARNAISIERAVNAHGVILAPLHAPESSSKVSFSRSLFISPHLQPRIVLRT